MDNKYGVVGCLRHLIKLLPSSSGRRLKAYLGATVTVSLMETVALAVVVVFVTAITNPSSIRDNRYFDFIAALFPQIALMDARHIIAWLAFTVVILVVTKNVYRGFIQYRYARFMGYLSGYIAETLLERMLFAPYNQTMNINSAELVCSVTWTAHCRTLLNSIFMTITESLLMVIMLGALFWENPSISLLALLCIGIPGVLIMVFIKPRIDHFAKQEAKHRRTAYLSMLMALHGLKDVKIHRQESSFQEKYAIDAYAGPISKAKQDLLASIPGFSLEACGFLLLSLSVIFMFFFLNNSSAEVTGTLALLAVTAWRGLPAGIRTVNAVAQLRGALPYINDTLQQFENFSDIPPTLNTASAPPSPFENQLTLKSVSFRYTPDGPNVLHDVSFHIDKGELVGIVGQSGAGKSTLMDILIGLLPPNDGTLAFDGKPFNVDALEQWRALIGYVPQAPYIYDATLAENIAFGRRDKEINMAKISETCAQAGVDEFLPQLEHGLGTSIGERGLRLSGGQQQRVCIARALYDSPELLVFDEATSSLDTKSEKQIQKTILELKGKLTMVIVAHRLSTVTECDRLIWIENGRVRATGTPDEILPQYRTTLRLDHENKTTNKGIAGA